MCGTFPAPYTRHCTNHSPISDPGMASESQRQLSLTHDLKQGVGAGLNSVSFGTVFGRLRVRLRAKSIPTWDATPLTTLRARSGTKWQAKALDLKPPTSGTPSTVEGKHNPDPENIFLSRHRMRHTSSTITEILEITLNSFAARVSRCSTNRNDSEKLLPS